MGLGASYMSIAPCDYAVGLIDATEVLHTSEVRWFAVGPLSSPPVSWFASSVMAAEVRRDRYLVNGAADVGMKHRNSGPLEVKSRCGSGGRLHLGDEKWGLIEDWRKVTAMGDVAAVECDGGVSLDVYKVILTRSYAWERDVMRPLFKPDLLEPGCDIELASVRVGDVSAWTFALGAWGGDGRERRRTLHEAWGVFIGETPLPDGFVASCRDDQGYPGWLAAIAAQQLASSA